jgi:hypothetical protein
MSKVYVDPTVMSEWKTQMEKINKDCISSIEEINTAITKQNPIKPVLIPDKKIKYPPVIAIINILPIFFIFKSGKIINTAKRSVVHILFADSNHPLYPIPSKYVVYDVFVTIDIIIDKI